MFPSLYFTENTAQDSGVMNPVHGSYSGKLNKYKDKAVEDYSSFFTETDALKFNLNNQLINHESLDQDYDNQMLKLDYQNPPSYSPSPAISYTEGWTGHLMPEVRCGHYINNFADYFTFSECW